MSRSHFLIALALAERCDAITSPMSDQAAMDHLNSVYMGFDPSDDTSPLGLNINMRPGPDNDMQVPMFCGKCFMGHADCGTSTSIYNNQMLINYTSGVPIPGLKRGVGIVYNDSGVENTFGKCGYMWDGATDNRLNFGCGGSAPGAIDQPGSCTDKTTAFFNIDPKTGKEATGTSPTVVSMSCAVMDPMPLKFGQPACYFPGAAFYPPGQKSQLRDMVKSRLKNQHGTETDMSTDLWNEVILDDTIMIPNLKADPISVVMAFVYVDGWNPSSTSINKQQAEKWVSNFQTAHSLPAPPPLLRWDVKIDARVKGATPFTLPASSAIVV